MFFSFFYSCVLEHVDWASILAWQLVRVTYSHVCDTIGCPFPEAYFKRSPRFALISVVIPVEGSTSLANSSVSRHGFIRGSSRTLEGQNPALARQIREYLLSSWRFLTSPPTLQPRQWEMENLAPRPSHLSSVLMRGSQHRPLISSRNSVADKVVPHENLGMAFAHVPTPFFWR